MEDLKVKIDKDSFLLIQDEVIGNGAEWVNTGNIKIEFKNVFEYLYFRKRSKSLEIGIFEPNFNTDKATQLSVVTFIKNIKGK